MPAWIGSLNIERKIIKRVVGEELQYLVIAWILRSEKSFIDGLRGFKEWKNS